MYLSLSSLLSSLLLFETSRWSRLEVAGDVKGDVSESESELLSALLTRRRCRVDIFFFFFFCSLS